MELSSLQHSEGLDYFHEAVSSFNNYAEVNVNAVPQYPYIIVPTSDSNGGDDIIG